MTEYRKKRIQPEVYLSDIRAFEQCGLYKRALDCVTEVRRKKTEQLRFEKDRCLSLCAGLLLQTALLPYGIRLRETDAAVNEWGKPYLPAYPEVCFNLSHSGEKVMLALSAGPVGCDVQEIGELHMNVAQRFFRPEEYADILARESVEKQRERFYQYWTLKESYIKAVGQGIRALESGYSFESGAEIIRVRPSLLGTDYVCRMYKEIPGYALSVCAADGMLPGREIRKLSVEECLERSGA